MPPETSRTKAFIFGPFYVDLAAREVRRRRGDEELSEPIGLTHDRFETLVTLLHHAGRVVAGTTDDKARPWTALDDMPPIKTPCAHGTLVQHVRALRLALAPDRVSSGAESIGEMQGLSPEERLVLLLAADRKSPQAIATRLGRDPADVLSLMCRATRNLLHAIAQTRAARRG
jgi:hypothetical protein